MKYQNVRRGDSIKRAFTARTFNEFAETAERVRALRQGQQDLDNLKLFKTATLDSLVFNESAANLDRYSTIGIDAPNILPTEAEGDFSANVLKGGATTELGKFGIYRQAVEDQNIGKAATAGIIECKLHIPAYGSWIQRADVDTTDASRLLAAPEGSAQILWRADPADPAAAETVDAIVRIGLPQNVVVIGKANMDILADQPPTPNNVRIWSDDQTDTGTIVGSTTNGYNITGHLDWMTGGQQISADKQVGCLWMPREGIWRIMWAECEDAANVFGELYLSSTSRPDTQAITTTPSVIDVADASDSTSNVTVDLVNHTIQIPDTQVGEAYDISVEVTGSVSNNNREVELGFSDQSTTEWFTGFNYRQSDNDGTMVGRGIVRVATGASSPIYSMLIRSTGGSTTYTYQTMAWRIYKLG